MKPHITFLVLSLLLSGTANAASKCSHANLTRCLDSACAINISANPAARCQYCGTASAGAPKVIKGMRAVSAGASAKYNISDKDLKKAPTDPGERYAWATSQCVKKVAGCTADDVTDAYDKLIEQSCKAAGVTAKLEKTLKATSKKKAKSVCVSEIESCLIMEKHCMSDYRNCEENSDFDKFFSACGVDAAGCDDYIGEIRTELIANRDSAIKNADKILAQITEKYSSARDKKLSSIRSGCADHTIRDQCVETVCATNMTNQCGIGFESEKSMAIQLCKFYDIACETID